MQLAQRAVLHSAKALKQHRQQHPAKYERVIEKEGQWQRYYSDSPATLYGEYLLSHFEGDLSGRLLYAEKLDDSHWYIASFIPQLEQEAIGTLATLSHSLGYALHHAERIWVTDNDFYLHIDKDARCSHVEVPNKATLSEFELTIKPKSKRTPIALGVGLALCLSVLGGVWMMQPKAPPPTVAPIDTAKLMYEQSWSSKVAARDALLSARNLLIQASLMPPSMSAKAVILEGQSLTLPITKDKVTRVMESAWQNAAPDLASYYQSSDALTGLITLPLPVLPAWQGYSVHGYRTLLIDGLERLGASVTEQSVQTIDDTTITTVYVEMDSANIGQVGIMADLLNAPYAVMSQLDMEMNEQYQLSRLNFTLDVQGD